MRGRVKDERERYSDKNWTERESRASVAKVRAWKMKRLSAGWKKQDNALWRGGEYIVRDKVCVV